MQRIALPLLVCALGCSAPGGSSTRSQATAAPASAPTAADAGAEPAALESSAPDAAPKVSPRATDTWPFVEWDGAQVVLYNLVPQGPVDSLFAYRGDKGLNESIASQRPIALDQAREALSLLSATLGGMDVSKCPFPRHAVVLTYRDQPVASINVCFECGDILVWPAYEQDEGWRDRKYGMYPKLMKAYDRVFPKWTAFFEKELGIPSDWTKIPPR